MTQLELPDETNPSTIPQARLIVIVHGIALALLACSTAILSTEWFQSWNPIEEEWAQVGNGTLFLALASAQAALLGAVAACSIRPFLFRLRWLFRFVVVQWLCLTLPMVPELKHWQFPLSVVACQLLFVVPAFLVAGVVRLVGKRILVCRPWPRSQFPERSQMSLADLFLLITSVAIVVGVGRHFSEDAVGWDTLTYAIMLGFGMIVGLPTGILVPLLAWGLLAERDRTATIWQRVWCGLIGALAIAALVLTWCGWWVHDDCLPWAMLCFGIAIGCSVILATATAFRRLDYRFRRRVSIDESGNGIK